MKTSKFFVVMILIGMLFSLAVPGGTARADEAESVATSALTPLAIVNQKGTSVGAVARMRVKDQSGIADNPLKYVLFKTPGVVYQGYRTYTFPAPASPGAVTNIKITVNYKGLPKASQTWSWFLFDWVANKWVKVGDNTGATLNVWKTLQFNVTASPTRFINNITRQMRLRLVSNKATGDAKLDYEAITLAYKPCNDPLGCVVVRPKDMIHIAYLLNMPVFESENGARVAIDVSAGKILNRNVKFDGVAAADCDNAAALAAATKMRKDASILAVIGTTCSGEAVTVMPGFSSSGFLMVSPSNTKPSLTAPGDPENHPGYSRVSWNDIEQGSDAADYAWGLGVTTAATIDDGFWYSVALKQAFVDQFVALGGTITTSQAITPGQTDMSTELAAIAATSPGLVFMPVFMPEAGYIVNQARASGSGLETVLLMGSDAMNTSDLFAAVGANIDGFLFTNGADSTQYSAAYANSFVPAYTTKFGAPPSEGMFSAYGYDAFNLIKAAILSAAVPQADGSLLIGRQALRNALYATSGMPGLTGTLTCTATGDCAATPAIGVWEYQADGSKVHVWP